jgi:hypothetical protein
MGKKADRLQKLCGEHGDWVHGNECNLCLLVSFIVHILVDNVAMKIDVDADCERMSR